MSEVIAYTLTVNGEDHEVAGAWLEESLLSVLRDRLGLTGAKQGCDQGECGACSVLLDGTLVCSCLVLAAAAAGAEVTTIEGISPGDGLTALQQAFIDEGAVQCGVCTPGLVVALEDLLHRDTSPSTLDVREAISGNLCRCTGYGRILQAVERVVEERRGE